VALALQSRPAELLARAAVIADALGADVAEAVPSRAAVGGGGAPGVDLESAAVSLPAHLADPLRRGDPAVVGHVVDGRLLLDLVAVSKDQDDALVDAVRRALGSSGAWDA
jgi:L-seryl-tRNA(Ser) seleniumtransferase